MSEIIIETFFFVFSYIDFLIFFADLSGFSGNSKTSSESCETLLWSIPAFAQINPCLVSTIRVFSDIFIIFKDSLRISSIKRGSFLWIENISSAFFEGTTSFK